MLGVVGAAIVGVLTISVSHASAPIVLVVYPFMIWFYPSVICCL
jgi:hypothetical protein